MQLCISQCFWLAGTSLAYKAGSIHQPSLPPSDKHPPHFDYFTIINQGIACGRVEELTLRQNGSVRRKCRTEIERKYIHIHGEIAA